MPAKNRSHAATKARIAGVKRMGADSKPDDEEMDPTADPGDTSAMGDTGEDTPTQAMTLHPQIRSALRMGKHPTCSTVFSICCTSMASLCLTTRPTIR